MPVWQLTTCENRCKVEVCFPLRSPSPLIIPQRRRCLAVRNLLSHQAWSGAGTSHSLIPLWSFLHSWKIVVGLVHFLIDVDRDSGRRRWVPLHLPIHSTCDAGTLAATYSQRVEKSFLLHCYLFPFL